MTKTPVTDTSCFALLRKGRIMDVTKDALRADQWILRNPHNQIIAGHFVPKRTYVRKPVRTRKA